MGTNKPAVPPRDRFKTWDHVLSIDHGSWTASFHGANNTRRPTANSPTKANSDLINRVVACSRAANLASSSPVSSIVSKTATLLSAKR